MNHTVEESMLVRYAAGQLSTAERAALEQHLAGCAECRADLALWRMVAEETGAASRAIAAPPQLAERALARIQAPSGAGRGLARAWMLLRAQALLVQREIWPANAAVMALAIVVALISGQTGVVYFVAPLLAAASLAALSGQENDPAFELTAAAPTSAWKILLARLSVVSAYNLLLALAAIGLLLAFAPPGLLGVAALGWLAPMACLSALALLLSLWLGTGNALLIAYALWIFQYLPYQHLDAWMAASFWTPAVMAWRLFWQSPQWTIAAALAALGAALWSAGRPGVHHSRQ